MAAYLFCPSCGQGANPSLANILAGEWMCEGCNCELSGFISRDYGTKLAAVEHLLSRLEAVEAAAGITPPDL